MITTTLSGGLGNQMFMYAMVKAMAMRNKASFAFNLNLGFEKDYLFKRKLELDNFNTQLPKGNFQTFDYKGSRIVRVFSRHFGRNILYPVSKFIVEETPLHFQKELLLENSKNIYLEGYWQCEDYFKDYEQVIRNDFELKTQLPERVYKEFSSIKDDSRILVFVGIRRYQECNEITPGLLLDEVYYNKAIEIMESKIPNIKFVVFTQEQEWAKAHIKSKSPLVFATFKEGELSAVADMYLMTQCDHAIISNSTFYWWGAWLQNTNPNEHIVISPNNFINRDSTCKSWLMI